MDFLADVKKFIKFCEDTFPMATLDGAFIKLEEELKEIKKAETAIEKRDEYVDCLMILFHAARKEGIHPEFILKGFANKTEVNINRKWKYNGDGTYSHIK